MNVAIIPARGGSQRVPRKNVRPFAGKPMIAHSIDRAIESRLFERVIVSTDDEEIARVASDCGAEVPFARPATLADAHTGTREVIAHAVTYLQDEGKAFEAVCCIYATAPFIRIEDLEKGLALLSSGSWRYVISAATVPFPIFRTFRKTATGSLEMVFPEHASRRSQDLPDAFFDAAQFYWGRPDVWLEDGPIFDARSTAVEIPRWRVQDIDTEEDWIRAEAMMSYMS